MNSKCKLRLPDIKELQGEDALDPIKIRGSRTKMSDFSLMTGGFYNFGELTEYKTLPSDLDYEYFEQNTKYITGNIKDDNVITIGGLEKRDISRIRRKDNNVGIRLVSDIDDNSNIKNLKRENGVTEVELGYFPQRRIIDYNEREKLQKAIKKGKLTETPYEYTIDTKLINEWARNSYGRIRSSKRKVRVYEYKDKLYIKFNMPIKGDFECNEELVEVLPVKWWYDSEKKKMIMADVLAYGVEYDNINPFLDNMSRELFQIKERNKQKEGIKGFFSRLVNKNKLKALPNGTQEIQHNEIMGKDEIVWEPENRVDINECLNGHSKTNPFILGLQSWKQKRAREKHGNEVSPYAPKKAKENKPKRNSGDIDDTDDIQI